MPQAEPLPNTLGDAVSRCQALMGDPTGQWCSRAYAVPFIQQAYSDITKQVKNGSAKNFEMIVELLAVPPGTWDLSVYQKYKSPPNNERGPLVGLWDPLRIWIKTAGQSPQFYCEAIGPRDTLPHYQPPGISPAGIFAPRITFAWIGNKLSIVAVNGPTDIQVYGRFNPPRLQSDSDELLVDPDMTDTLAYSACAIMGVERTNPAILQGYADRGLAGVDNIIASVIRQTQRTPRRLAQMGGSSGGGGSSWGWY